MTPDEKTLLSGLFDRIRNADGGPRDAEAERFIADAVRLNPHAPYLMAQSVLIQEQALSAANQKIQELQAQVAQAARPQESGSFLGSIGKSLFGGSSAPAAQPAAPQPNYATQRSGYAPSYPAAQPGPWGSAPSGGGFLSGALNTAAGVAGGMLLADGIRSLFGGHQGNGMMAHIAGSDFGQPGIGSQTINNFYGDSAANQSAADYLQDQDQDQDDLQDAADVSYDDGSSFSDTSDA